MTEYGKTKCELLEKKGFDANNMAWWIVEDGEYKRTYAYVNKKVGSEVKKLTINVTDDIADINSNYQKMLNCLSEYKDYLKDEFGKDAIGCPDAETSNTMEYISVLAHNIDKLNMDSYDVESGMPWSEVSDIFDCDCMDDENWYLKDDPELFGEENI